jgi:D-alanine transaminase
MAAPYPLCYLNGDFVAIEAARISPFDRGFLYSDGAYEVMPVYAGRPFRFRTHLDRMTRSLGEIRMEDPHTADEWRDIITKLIAPQGNADQYVYWQVTRGAELGRNHAPLPKLPRTVFAFAAPFPKASAESIANGVACVTAHDTRWARRDIKSVSLLANVLLRQLAVDANASETILLSGGELTEASSSAVHVVINGELRSPPNSWQILPGTTRGAVEKMAERLGIPFRSVNVTEGELRSAEEIWLSSAGREMSAVTLLDGRRVGDGKVGPLYQRVRAELERYKAELAGTPW